jgi:hypothetical protein
MKRYAHIALLSAALVSLLSLRLSFASDQEGDPLDGPERKWADGSHLVQSAISRSSKYRKSSVFAVMRVRLSL